MGSTIDPEGGVVQLTTASDRRGGRKLVLAQDGRFTVRQRDGVTRLGLSGKPPTKKDCRRASTQRGTANRRKVRIRAKGPGLVQVEGDYSTGASYGTSWITEDRCDGTLTTVRSGTVRVRDLGRGRTVSVRPGDPYLAKKP